MERLASRREERDETKVTLRWSIRSLQPLPSWRQAARLHSIFICPHHRLLCPDALMMLYLGWKVTPRGYSGSLPEILSLYEIWCCKKPAWRSLKKVNCDGFWLKTVHQSNFRSTGFKLTNITKTNRLSQTTLSNQVLRSFRFTVIKSRKYLINYPEKLFLDGSIKI